MQKKHPTFYYPLILSLWLGTPEASLDNTQLASPLTKLKKRDSLPCPLNGIIGLKSPAKGVTGQANTDLTGGVTSRLNGVSGLNGEASPVHTLNDKLYLSPKER